MNLLVHYNRRTAKARMQNFDDTQGREAMHARFELERKETDSDVEIVVISGEFRDIQKNHSRYFQDVVIHECILGSACPHYPRSCECTHPWYRHYHTGLTISGPEGSAGYDG